MKLNEKYIINQAIILFAYGYTLNEYKFISILFSLISILLTIYINGLYKIRNKLIFILVLYLFLNTILFECSLLECYQVLSLNILASSFSFISFWNMSSHTYRFVAISEFVIFIINIFVLLLIKDIWVITLQNAILIMCLVYLPSILSYTYSRLNEMKQIERLIEDRHIMR